MNYGNWLRVFLYSWENNTLGFLEYILIELNIDGFLEEI